MKMKSLLVSAMCLSIFAGISQEVAFEEYDLDNDLHVILHQDNTAPLISISVLYHVGSKDEDPQRTGFAHFFEHLLFEGTENIKKGNGTKLFLLTVAQETLPLMRTEPTTTKYSPLTI